MKKIIIIAAIVCGAATIQAANANWKASANNIFDGTGSTLAANKYSGSAYYFNADAISQKSLFALFDANNKIDLTAQTGYLDTGVVASGVINMNTADNQFSAFAQSSGDHSFYFVLIDDDMMYLSNIKTVGAGGTDAAVTIGFSSQNTGSGTYSASLPTKGYSGAGMWAQSVPEPTSGLLLLLGMAGLALKRKRA